jgi:uncharacterized protein
MRFDRRQFIYSGATAGLAAAPSATMTRRLGTELDKVRLFDSHEHLIPEKQRVAEDADFFLLLGHYALNDLISAGLTDAALKIVRDPKAADSDRWNAAEPYWRAARSTGYCQALSIAVRDLYAVEDISAASIGRINAAIREQNKAGLYARVLQQKAGIDWCLVDPYWNEKPAPASEPNFLLAQKFDGFVTPASPKDIARLEQISEVSIHSLDDLKKALEATFEQALKAGMTTVKSTLAYRRKILYREVPASDAAASFEAMLKGSIELPKGFRAAKARVFRDLEDHMFHHLVKLASEHRAPFQIHTGLLAGNSGFVENTNPRYLANLFHLYPTVKFDLFHIGYPYQQELGVLAKLFPNVYVDFCWAHIISPVGARDTLDEYLEMMPANKILGFGGDYRYPELTYGHSRIARANVAAVLAAKVAGRVMSEDQALEVGRMLLRDNALALFKPSERRAAG